MYQAIVFLPLLGAILAGLIAIAGARTRFPGEGPPPGAEEGAAASDHGTHAGLAHGGADHHHTADDLHDPVMDRLRAGRLRPSRRARDSVHLVPLGRPESG